MGVDLRKAEEEIAKARATGIRLKYNPFSWRKAYTHTPSQSELSVLHSEFQRFWDNEHPLVVDPMAGGGSIPFEAMRLGLPIVAGDLNPVAYICLKGTLEYPARFGEKLLPAVAGFCKEVHESAKAELEGFFPKESGEKVYAYLWARTIKCSSCGLTIPLSPNWWIIKTKNDKKSIGIKLIVSERGNECSFEVVRNPVSVGLNPDKGTTKRNDIECPRCHIVIPGKDVRRRARNGEIGHQLYTVYTKRNLGTKRIEWCYRLPTDSELSAVKKAEAKLVGKLEEYRSKGFLPEEPVPEGFITKQPKNFGLDSWYRFFSSRQLLTHLIYLEKFLEAKRKLFAEKDKAEWDFVVAVLTYGAIVFDTCLNYNSLLSRWQGGRGIRGATDIQAFPFRMSYAEWDHSEMLWPWASSKVLNALKEIINLLPESLRESKIYCRTATSIPLNEKSVPCIVVDPPYAENVFYGESSDFFYVWLKRLLGDVFPDIFQSTLTEKEEEAVSNPAKFRGTGRNAKKLAQEDYKTKMEACFREMNRILVDDGVMTVMFTHRTAEAWSSLATALMNADFTFISSWPVHTETPEKFAKKGKGVLKITVLLTCRKRTANHPGIWEHIVDELRDVAKQKIEEFSKLGINGPDLKVSVYGPVLGRFADYYPVKTATGREIDPQEALDQVTDVLNERFLQEAGIQTADKETAAYINLLANFPTAQTEYEEARLATVFGGLVTLDTLDIKGAYGFIEKDGKNIRILSARDRQAKGIIDPYDHKTLKTTIDHVHAAILQYERGGLIQVKRLMQDKNLDTAGSPFPTVLQAYARYAENSSNENFQKDAAIAKALLTALGKSIEFAPKKGERLDHYVSES